jgi:DNA polymerase-2
MLLESHARRLMNDFFLMSTPNAFLLTRHWRDTPEGITLDFWWATDAGPRWTSVTQQETVFFVPRQQSAEIHAALKGLRHWRMAEVNLCDFYHRPVNALYCLSTRISRDAQSKLENAGIVFWEADIKPPERYLMERFVTAGAQLALNASDPINPLVPWINPGIAPWDYRPRLKMVSLDIETSMDAKTLYSIGVWSETERRVFMVGDGADTDVIHYCADTATCLMQFFAWLEAQDPDVLIGWNLVQFDLWVLESLCQTAGVNFAMARGGQSSHWRQEEDTGRRYVSIPGRVALDGIELLKAANHIFTSYSLENVAQTLLGDGKLLHGSQRGEDITRLFHTDKPALAAYNLQDCKLVWDIFQQENLLHFALERSHLTGLLLDRVGGSVAAFEYSYLPRLHRRGYVAPNLGELRSDVVSPGGYVMDSRPGIYRNVLVLDFKSLYPSIIRTFLIDPCGFWLAQHRQLPPEETVPGFNGACFARDGHILPQIIEHLSAARDRAKAERNAPLSHAIKIIMNSFYGVLGSPGCRFFDPRVCSSITLRGHQIIQRSRDWIEQQGYQVIYGDTDSLFVWLEQDNNAQPKSSEECRTIGLNLAQGLNAWWRATLLQEFKLASALEIQFETHYQQFLMPTMRGSEQGSKKRYAGVVEKNGEQTLVFKGLENVRTDWTALARNFQLELYRRIFLGEDHRDFVRSTAEAVLSGQRDAELVYRKRLRRHLHEYQKNVPPHVQAARKLLEWRGTPVRRGDWIDYVITRNGPEPADCHRSPLDYQHYVDKQLTPVADTILHFVDQSMAGLVEKQLTLFQ